MNSLYIIVVTFVGYILAYKLYGKFLASKVFQINDANKTPAVTYEDNRDFIPSTKFLVFGHHFTSIAGTGPIVGPAIGIIWGWLPALLWVFWGQFLWALFTILQL